MSEREGSQERCDGLRFSDYTVETEPTMNGLSIAETFRNLMGSGFASFAFGTGKGSCGWMGVDTTGFDGGVMEGEGCKLVGVVRE